MVMITLAGVAFAVFAFLFFHKFEGLRSNDEAHYSQLARNLSSGHGFTTKAITPIDLAIDPRVDDHPDYWRAPLYPLILGIAYLFMGPKEYGGVLVSGLFFILLAPMLYLFGRRLSERAIGISAAAIALALPQMWDYSLHALTEMSFAFLLVCLLYSIYARANPFVTGLVFGLCYLNRYNALFYVPVIIWFFAVVDKYTWRRMGMFAAGAFVVSAPWLIRNTALTGNPLFSLQNYMPAMFTTTYPGYTVYASFDPISVAATLRDHPWDVLSKYARGLNYLTGEIPSLTHPVIMLLFVGGALALHAPRRKRFLQYAFFIMMIIQLHLVALAVSPVEPLIRHFVPFIPVIVIFAVFAFEQLVRLVPRPRTQRFLTAAMVVVVITTSVNKGRNIDCEPMHAVSEQEIEYIKRLGSGPVVTDQAWELAWKADRAAIWAPAEYSGFRERLSAIRYVFFSGTPFEPSESTSYRREYLENPDFNRAFVLEKRFDEGGMLFHRAGERGQT
ncbi:MAG: glycosyltransferase family 39 protein [Candidatus Lindowbacteria bacterium]|nr:glycosyltransferase family 39 protein [Candidatus Lindowbacteria bacterium]